MWWWTKFFHTINEGISALIKSSWINLINTLFLLTDVKPIKFRSGQNLANYSILAIICTKQTDWWKNLSTNFKIWYKLDCM